MRNDDEKDTDKHSGLKFLERASLQSLDLVPMLLIHHSEKEAV